MCIRWVALSTLWLTSPWSFRDENNKDTKNHNISIGLKCHSTQVSFVTNKLLIPWNIFQCLSKPRASMWEPYTINGSDDACLRVVTVEREDGIRFRGEYHHADSCLSWGNRKETNKRFDEIKNVSEMLSYAAWSIHKKTQVHSWLTNWKHKKGQCFTQSQDVIFVIWAHLKHY